MTLWQLVLHWWRRLTKPEKPLYGSPKPACPECGWVDAHDFACRLGGGLGYGRPLTKPVWSGPTYCQTCGYRANFRYDEMGHYMATDHVTFGPRPPAKEPEG